MTPGGIEPPGPPERRFYLIALHLSSCAASRPSKLVIGPTFLESARQMLLGALSTMLTVTQLVPSQLQATVSATNFCTFAGLASVACIACVRANAPAPETAMSD